MIGFQSPQWGSNSKVVFKMDLKNTKGFSPRNGEVILKLNILITPRLKWMFQSPQWGSNSKEEISVHSYK